MTRNVQTSNGGTQRSPSEVFASLDKKDVFKSFMDLKFKTLKTLTDSIEDTSQRARDAPGSMQSHHDVSKKELGWLVDGLKGRQLELATSVSVAARFAETSNSNVSAGALVLIKANKSEEAYFVIPGGEGVTFEIQGLEITAVSPATPLAKAMWEKEKGYTFKFGPRDCEIMDVK